MATLGKPAITTPARLDLRPIQEAIQNSRQRIEALEAAVNALNSASLSASAIAALQAQVTAITLASGTVTSVRMTVPTFMSVSGSPITSSGTLAVSFANQPAGMVLAGPVSGADAAPDFRALEWYYDLPLFSTLSFTSGLDGSEIIPIERYGNMFWTTLADIAAFARSGGAPYTRGASWSGAGAAITTSTDTVFVECPVAGTITQVTVLTAGGPGSCVIDIWKDSYSLFPPTVADTITASAKPTISSAVKYQDTTLTGWTTAVAAGDVLAFHIDSVSTFTYITISVVIQP